MKDIFLMWLFVRSIDRVEKSLPGIGKATDESGSYLEGHAVTWMAKHQLWAHHKWLLSEHQAHKTCADAINSGYLHDDIVLKKSQKIGVVCLTKDGRLFRGYDGLIETMLRERGKVLQLIAVGTVVALAYFGSDLVAHIGKLVLSVFEG